MENNVTETLKGEAYSGLCRVNAVTSLVREKQSSETHPVYIVWNTGGATNQALPPATRCLWKDHGPANVFNSASRTFRERINLLF